jgi:hypothetical protein
MKVLHPINARVANFLHFDSRFQIVAPVEKKREGCFLPTVDFYSTPVSHAESIELATF